MSRTALRRLTNASNARVRDESRSSRRLRRAADSENSGPCSAAFFSSPCFRGPAGSCAPNRPPAGASSVTRALSPDEFARAGLNKLTAEELDFLEAVLARRQTPAPSSKAAPTAPPSAIAPRGPSKEKIAAAFGAEQVAPAKPTSDGDKLHTTIEGAVQEFSGRAVFVLGNGQIWQLRTPTDVFLPKKLLNPAVTLIRGAFGYKLVIDAADIVLFVKRIQ